MYLTSSRCFPPSGGNPIEARQRRNSIILFVFSFISCFEASALELCTSFADETEVLLGAINSFRAKEGVHALINEEPAASAATLHAKELAERNLLSHRSLDGKRVVERYRFAKGTGTEAGENLGAGESIESILIAWMRSPSHRSNLLNTKWYNAGFGQARTEKGRMVLVAIFTNSRWRDSFLDINRGIATLSGQLVHPKDMPTPKLSIRINGSEIDPLPSELGAKRTVFGFPEPLSWQEGGMISILLSVTEFGVTKQVDLLLLEAP